MINLNFIYSEIFLCLAIMILLLTGVFLYTMHMNNTPRTYKEPLPLVKTETTFVDLEKNIQSVDSKNIISN